MMTIQRLLALCRVTGPITYAIILTILGLLWSGYDPIAQYMSELGAVDAPHAIVMNVMGFQLLGISMIGFAFGLHCDIGEGWDSKVGVALIIVSGASMIAVGFFPCDPGCANVSPTGVGHAMTATTASIAMTFGMLVLSFRFRRDKRWQGYWLPTFSAAIIATVLSPLPMFPLLTPWAGLIQRLGMAIALFWMVATGGKLLR